MSKDIVTSNDKTPGNSNPGGLDLTNIQSAALSASLTKLKMPRLFYQLVVFVLDGSGSMTYQGKTGKSKGEEIEDSILGVIKRLNNSRNKNSFDLNMWAFADESKEMLPVTPLEQIDNDTDLNPCNYIEEYRATNMLSTLKDVKVNCENYLQTNQDKNAQALIIILSDGAIHHYNETYEICNQIKNKKGISISSIFFESINWQEDMEAPEVSLLQDNLMKLASSPKLFASTLDPEEVRKHMIKSISTVSRLDS